jgi:hypothetical protein
MKTNCGSVGVLLGAMLFAVGCSDNHKPEPSGTASDSPPEIIQPNVSVGKVHAGMTVKQVEAELGKPDYTTANALEYSKRGFAVMPNREGLVQVVMCGDVTGNNGPFVQRFHAKTKEGIGLGSTRDELIKAYGEPSNDEKFPGNRESMRYDPLGITFSLESGKVHHMIVRLKMPDTNNAAPAQSIEVTK